jgi:hypothetical protein
MPEMTDIYQWQGTETPAAPRTIAHRTTVEQGAAVFSEDNLIAGDSRHQNCELRRRQDSGR